MIEFKQLASGTPPDIEVTTDDGDAEMAMLDDVLRGDFPDFQAPNNLAQATRGEDGKFRFVIPGDEAGEIGDVWLPLEDFIEKANQETIARAEGIAQQQEESM